MLNNAKPASPASRVVCICGGYGFPNASASAARITSVGRALLAEGIEFSLLHCGPSPHRLNSVPAGVHHGIRFNYTTPVRRPASRLALLAYYLLGAFLLALRLVALRFDRRPTAIYLYVMEGWLYHFAALVCRLLGFPIVQELCEWLPGDSDCPAITLRIYRKSLFRHSAAVLAISAAIEERVNTRSRQLRRLLPVMRLPNILDTAQFTAPQQLPVSLQHDEPVFVYCGTWTRDMRFIFRAFSSLRAAGHSCKLLVLGGWSLGATEQLHECASAEGVSAGDLVIAHCVDDATLVACYQSAAALLMPLFDDDRSITRLPNKMGEYLASGRPVITQSVGDLRHYLTDGVDAYITQPGDPAALAAAMSQVLLNPERATAIGAQGRKVALAKLDFRAHSVELAEFFRSAIESRFSTPHAHLIPGPHVASTVRRIGGALLALALIGSGAVHAATRRALSGGVITAVYFHNPTRRLFQDCIEWLTRSGYTFVSADQVLSFVEGREQPPRGAVWISFDDAWAGSVHAALPAAESARLPVTLFVPTGIVAGSGQFPWLDPRSLPPGARAAMTREELLRVASRPGVSLGTHTVTHTITPTLAPEGIRYELERSKADLEEWTRQPTQFFAYPEGRHNGSERQLLKSLGYRLAATTESRLITASADPFLVPRFSVADNITLPEAICNMTGVWGPVIGRLKSLLRVGPAV